MPRYILIANPCQLILQMKMGGILLAIIQPKPKAGLEELNVYKIIRDDPTSINGMGKLYTGKAVITQVSEGHVTAKITAGKADTKAMVEVPPFFTSPPPRMVSSTSR